MPILIIIGILSVWLVIWLKDKLTPPCRAFTPEEIKRMSSEMVGKSKSECNRIIQRYNKTSPKTEKEENEHST